MDSVVNRYNLETIKVEGNLEVALVKLIKFERINCQGGGITNIYGTMIGMEVVNDINEK